MDQAFSLTLEQVDHINNCLAKAMAVTQMVGECGEARRPVPGDPPPVSMYVVMQVVYEELEKVDKVMREISGGDSALA